MLAEITSRPRRRAADGIPGRVLDVNAGLVGQPVQAIGPNSDQVPRHRVPRRRTAQDVHPHAAVAGDHIAAAAADHVAGRTVDVNAHRVPRPGPSAGAGPTRLPETTLPRESLPLISTPTTFPEITFPAPPWYPPIVLPAPGLTSWRSSPGAWLISTPICWIGRAALPRTGFEAGRVGADQVARDRVSGGEPAEDVNADSGIARDQVALSRLRPADELPGRSVHEHADTVVQGRQPVGQRRAPSSVRADDRSRRSGFPPRRYPVICTPPSDCPRSGRLEPAFWWPTRWRFRNRRWVASRRAGSVPIVFPSTSLPPALRRRFDAVARVARDQVPLPRRLAANGGGSGIIKEDAVAAVGEAAVPERLVPIRLPLTIVPVAAAPARECHFLRYPRSGWEPRAGDQRALNSVEHDPSRPLPSCAGRLGRCPRSCPGSRFRPGRRCSGR